MEINIVIMVIYRQTVWSVLTGMSGTVDIPAVRKSVEEIDTWILRLLSSPAPVAGRTAVHVSCIFYLLPHYTSAQCLRP